MIETVNRHVCWFELGHLCAQMSGKPFNFAQTYFIQVLEVSTDKKQPLFVFRRKTSVKFSALGDCTSLMTLKPGQFASRVREG